MSVKYLWGFGGVRLRIASYQPSETYDGTSTHDVVLPYASAEIEFDPIDNVYTTVNHEQYVINMGYRGKFRVTATNACTDDYLLFQKLIAILNAGSYEAEDIIIYPRWLAADDNLSYNVRCTSSVNFESVAPTKSAQRIELTFETIFPVPYLPNLTSDPVNSYFVYSEDNGATTDNIITDTGDTLIFHTP